MQDEIRVQYEYVSGLVGDMYEAKIDFDNVRVMQTRSLESPAVEAALGKFHQHWDLRRDQLGTSLETLVDALAGVRDTLRELDTQLDASLKQDG